MIDRTMEMTRLPKHDMRITIPPSWMIMSITRFGGKPKPQLTAAADNRVRTGSRC